MRTNAALIEWNRVGSRKSRESEVIDVVPMCFVVARYFPCKWIKDRIKSPMVVINPRRDW